MERRCDKCVYWQPGRLLPTSDDNGHLATKRAGECRIGPPEASKYSPYRGRWPVTLADEYCHGFQAKEPT